MRICTQFNNVCYINLNMNIIFFYIILSLFSVYQNQRRSFYLYELFDYKNIQYLTSKNYLFFLNNKWQEKMKKRNSLEERKKPRPASNLALASVPSISRQRTYIDTTQSKHRLTRKKFPSLSSRLSTHRRELIDDASTERSARGKGSAREKDDGCQFLVDPLRGIGASMPWTCPRTQPSHWAN